MWPGHTPSLWKLFPSVDGQDFKNSQPRVALGYSLSPKKTLPPAFQATLGAPRSGALASGMTMFTEPQPTVRIVGARLIASLRFA